MAYVTRGHLDVFAVFVLMRQGGCSAVPSVPDAAAVEPPQVSSTTQLVLSESDRTIASAALQHLVVCCGVLRKRGVPVTCSVRHLGTDQMTQPFLGPGGHLHLGPLPARWRGAAVCVACPVICEAVLALMLSLCDCLKGAAAFPLHAGLQLSTALECACLLTYQHFIVCA